MAIKSILVLFLGLFFSVQLIMAQDIIKKNNGDKLDVQIVATSKSEITYIVKTLENKDSIVSIDKHLCYSIQKQGQAEEIVFAKEKEWAMIVTNEDSLNTYNEGRSDANIYYTKYKKPGTLVLVTSLISPIVGLIPAIISSATPVKEDNKFYPDLRGAKIDLYYKGYAREAKGKKQSVVWRNWTIGFLTNLCAVLIIRDRLF